VQALVERNHNEFSEPENKKAWLIKASARTALYSAPFQGR